MHVNMLSTSVYLGVHARTSKHTLEKWTSICAREHVLEELPFWSTCKLALKRLTSWSALEHALEKLTSLQVYANMNVLLISRP